MRSAACLSMLIALIAACQGEPVAKPCARHAYLSATGGKRLFPSRAPQPVAIPDAHHAYLSGAEGTRWFRPHSPPRRYFAPTVADIADFDARLVAELRRGDNPTLAVRAPGYLRQYVSYEDGRGQRWIWGNFFCRTPTPNEPEMWRSTLLHVSDGGDCYFNVEYSPDSGELRDLWVNGDA